MDIYKYTQNCRQLWFGCLLHQCFVFPLIRKTSLILPNMSFYWHDQCHFGGSCATAEAPSSLYQHHLTTQTALPSSSTLLSSPSLSSLSLSFSFFSSVDNDDIDSSGSKVGPTTLTEDYFPSYNHHHSPQNHLQDHHESKHTFNVTQKYSNVHPLHWLVSEAFFSKCSRILLWM